MNNEREAHPHGVFLEDLLEVDGQQPVAVLSIQLLHKLRHALPFAKRTRFGMPKQPLNEVASCERLEIALRVQFVVSLRQIVEFRVKSGSS